jgi:hypothetical protein
MPPKFCTSCGELLKFEQGIITYDEYTGEPNTNLLLKCPNYMKVNDYGRGVGFSIEPNHSLYERVVYKGYEEQVAWIKK